MQSDNLLKLLRETGAMLDGHFLLTSGQHSNVYIEKFRILENPKSLDHVCRSMAEIVQEKDLDIVLSAAIGGILIAGGVGRYLNIKHIFSERINRKMVFKRGFFIEENQNILIVEDIVTTGGSINELINLIEQYKGNIIGIISIVDRNDKTSNFKYEYETLLNFPSKSWNLEDCPDWLKKIPIEKPGSTGKDV